MPEATAAELKAVDPQGWSQFDENYSFLKAMKKNNGKGSADIYAKFVKAGSRQQINIAGTLRVKLDRDAVAKDWDSDNWEAAVKIIQNLFDNNVKGKIGPLMAKIDKKHKIALAKAL